MTEANKITVVTVCDNHYLILLAALLKSIEENHKTQEIVDFIIVEDGISRSNRQKLERSSKSEYIQIKWMSITEAVPPGMSLPTDKSSYPINIYVRAFIPWFVPPEIEKVLYLDVDMIMLDDISCLWNTDFQGRYLAAVQDPRIQTFDNSWGGIKNYRELGLSPHTKYFNTGLLLINTAGWRELGIAERVLACVQENRQYLNYPDQYALNIVFADQWFELDASWNHFVTSGTGSSPRIVHFVERKPIYSSYNNSSAFQNTFFEYLSRTEWKNARKIGECSRYLKKIKNLLNKIRAK